MSQVSLADLALDLLEFFADAAEEDLEILLLGVELFELSLDAGIFALVVGEVALAEWGGSYSSSWMRSSSVVRVLRMSAFLASKAFSKASLAWRRVSVSRL